jgi:predicted hotdog family 3-hydroxylacyl-ACP dehydratase
MHRAASRRRARQRDEDEHAGPAFFRGPGERAAPRRRGNRMSALRVSTLDHAAIEALVPHRGSMCLLERMLSCSETGIECVAINHRDRDHPLRSAGRLWASAAIEYAAQAAALHGALRARQAGGDAVAGYLASARDVRLAVLRLDTLPAAPAPQADELRIAAVRHAGDAARLLYEFTVSHGSREIASGRLAVVLHAPDTAVAA